MRLGPFTPRDHVVITTLGLEFAVAVGLCTAGGFLADKKLGSTPWLSIGGVFAGFALGMYMVVKEAKRMERAEAEQKDDKKNESL